MKGRSKYGAKKATCGAGHTHDSKREAARCDELHLLERGGVIRQLSVHPKFVFVVNGASMKMGNGQAAGYKADFQYFEGEKNIVEDVKGMILRDFPLRAAVFRACFPFLELRVTK